MEERRQKEKAEQEKQFSKSSNGAQIQELTDEEADKLQRELDAEKAPPKDQTKPSTEEKSGGDAVSSKVSCDDGSTVHINVVYDKRRSSDTDMY